MAALAFAALVLAVAAPAIGDVAYAQDAAPSVSAVTEDQRRVPMAAVSPPAPGAGQLPSQPRHPAAAKAYVVLETYCARCHQSGKSQGTGAAVPGGGLANILHLDEIARVPSLVRPGNPDGSEVYLRMFAHPEIIQSGVERSATEPTAPEIEAVREWIEDLGDGSRRGVVASCAARSFSGGGEQTAAIESWLGQIGDAAARDTRFLSLGHLQNSCATDAELAAYRQGVVKVLNSLSWSPARARVETVGDTLSLMAVRLSELGWLPAHWEKLVAAYPRGTVEPLPAAITGMTGTAVPVLRADWLASAATRSPLYYELIGLPPALDELGELIGLELGPRKPGVRRSAIAATGNRLGIRSSAITGGPRIIERQASKGRPVWVAYDVAAAGEGHDPFERPLGPVPPGTQGPGTFHASGARIVFALPNGMPGFGAYDGDGKRLDAAVIGVTGQREGSARGGRPGLGCFGCHEAGLVKAGDEMRAHVDGDKWLGDRDVREAARRRYPTAAEVQKMFDDDGYAFRRAMLQAGVDPDLKIHGLELVTALARQYDLDVGIERAGAEFGVAPQAFAERLKSFDGAEEAQVLALRLRQAPLSRADVERLYLALRTGGQPAGGSAIPVAARGLQLALWSETPNYRAGQLFAVYAAPSADCHLTVVSVDPQGRATVLYPNDFDQDNLVRGGRVQRIPARNGAYQLRLKDKGIETLVAICDTRAKAPDGIAHDFERQRFTVLGNWRNFLRGVANGATNGATIAKRDAERPGRRGARGRNGEARAESRSEQRSDSRAEAEQRPEASARAAIQVTVD